MNPTPAYIRAIRGPVLLITLGVLMLIDHLTDTSFWRLWPALLIVGGLMVLLERAIVVRPAVAEPAFPTPFTPQSPYGGAYTPPGAPRPDSDSGTPHDGGVK